MSAEGVNANISRIEDVVRTSIQAMKNKEGLFEFVDPQPEQDFVNLSKVNGQEFALNAMFMITPMVLAGKTEPFFKRISVPEVFGENAWLFEPNEVAKHSESEVVEACFRYLRPAGRQAEPIYQWFHNSKKISDEYGGLVSNYFKRRGNDAIRVYEDLTVRPRAKSYEKEIRRFGPKIAKLFIQWVREYDLYTLERTDEVGLPVDFQLGRVMIQTEGLKLDKPVNTHFIVHKVLPLLFEDLRLKGYRPEEISKALWAIGSGGCAYKRHEACPLRDLCTSLISSDRYDNDGMFDPKDVGRYK